MVDLGNTCLFGNSIPPTALLSGGTPASGVLVGVGVNMNNADTFCNLLVEIGPTLSGQAKIQIQCSDSDVSGNYTDPTSGLAQLPTRFLSGGIFVINSGGALSSGGSAAGGFQRTGTFARAILMSGDPNSAVVSAQFISQLRTTGSGGGFTYSPGSGSISV